MAIVGEAYVIVKPITAGFSGSVARDLKKLEGTAANAGRSAGKIYGGAFGRAFGPSGTGQFTNDQLRKAVSTGKAYANLSRAGYVLQAALGAAAGSIGALAGGVVALGSALLSAAPAAVALGGALASIGIGAAVAKLALSGVGKALGKLNQQDVKATKDTTAQQRRLADAKKALALVIESNREAIINADKEIDAANKQVTKSQEELNKALADGQEQLQQIGFDAEDAALAEKRAGLDLEKARENLARVQDLPPNSRARKEAELAYAEAELNLRRAKDKNADLAKEQERLAKTGVEGLDSVIAARENAAQADQALQDAKDKRSKEEIQAARRQKDAEEEVRRAQEDLDKAKSGAGGTDPLAGLTESQKKFTQFLHSLKPQIQELKEAAASAFLPKLQEGIQLIVDKAFPTIKTGVSEVGSALGDASKTFAAAIINPANLDKLATVFTNAAESIRKLGEIAGGIWGVVLSVLIAVDPLLQRFLTFMDTKIKTLDEKLNADPEKLKAFFDEAGRVAAEVGKIIGNIASGLGNIIKANTGPGTGGQIMLDYFKDITEAFKIFSGSAEGQNKLKDYFAGAAENTKAILGVLGDVTKLLLNLGADPNVKKFWDILGQAVDPLKTILTEGLKAAPAFAELVVNVLKIIAAFSGATGPIIFFNILNAVATVIRKIVESPIGKFLLEVTGVIHGVTLAFGLLVIGVKIAQALMLYWRIVTFNVIAAMSSLVAAIYKQVLTAISALQAGFARLTATMMANPFVAIAVAIVALVALFVVLYKKNEAFREFVDKAWAAIKETIGNVVDFLVGLFKTIWDGLKDGLEIAWKAVQAVWDLIVAGVKLYVKTLIAVYEFIWDVLKTGLELVWKGIQVVWDLIVAGVKIYIQTITTVIQFVWNVLKTGLDLVWTGIQVVWNLIVAGVKTYIGLVTSAISFVWDVLKTGLDAAWTGIQATWKIITTGISGLVSGVKKLVTGVWDGLSGGLQAAWEIAKNWWNTNVASKKLTIGGFEVFGKKLPSIELGLPRLAQGGTVMPSAGGTIAQIAEAGRPERVEPLDPDGLSKRDKAMIKLLAGNQGAGMTFNIYPSQGMNENDLAEMVSRKIAFMMRGGAIA